MHVAIPYPDGRPDADVRTFTAGSRAFRVGRLHTSNPFLYGTDDHARWHAGWAASQAVAEAEAEDVAREMDADASGAARV